MSADTIVPDPTSPQSLNRYAYVLNSPINFSDPTGHCPNKITVCIIGGATASRDSWWRANGYAVYDDPSLRDDLLAYGEYWYNQYKDNGALYLEHYDSSDVQQPRFSITAADLYVENHNASQRNKLALVPLFTLALKYGGEEFLDSVGESSGGGTVPLNRSIVSETTHKHHIFPQAYREEFESLGINIDDFVVEISQSEHLRGVHGRGGFVGSGDTLYLGRYNQQWGEFFANNPNPTTKEVFQFGGRLMDEYGLNNFPIIRYR